MVPDPRPPLPDDYQGWVIRLRDPARASVSFRHLLRSGDAALPAVRAGLGSRHAAVRLYCTRLLDHLVDVDSYSALIAMLGDVDDRVRCAALHALACDRCKSDGCRPAADDVLDSAIELLLADPEPGVRTYACEVVGGWVYSHTAAAEALIKARDADSHPMVRKKAGWYAPGGTIYAKHRPKQRVT